jgi:hypothetical protein
VQGARRPSRTQFRSITASTQGGTIAGVVIEAWVTAKQRQ